MIDKATIANPRTHYGAGRPATRLFVLQRLTGAFNIVFTLFFVWFVVSLAGAGRAGMVGLVRNPGIALALCLLIVNVCIHMRIGMREVIEDYIDEAKTHARLLRANDAFAFGIAVLGVASVAKILVWG